jgi:hypothetical protein
VQQNNARVEVTVEEVKDSGPGTALDQPSVVIETEAKVDGELRETAIEVREADAPAVAAALLNAEVADPPSGQDLPVAVHCLAAGIVCAATAGQVRLHLQFESGQVLPIEMSRDAAAALARVLVEHTRAG